MFGTKKKGNTAAGNNQVTEVPDLDFDDLVALGLIDQGLALSIQDYLEEEETSETNKPPTEISEPVIHEEIEVSKPEKEPQECKDAEGPLPQLKVVESPKQIVLPPLEGAEALPTESVPSCHPGDPVKLNVRMMEAGSPKPANVQQELTEILLDAKRYAKEERYQADEDAERILAKAKREAHLIEFEAQQRKEVLQKEYVEEVDKLLHRVDRTMEYFSVLQANTNQLFSDFLTKSEELAKELKDKGDQG